MKRFLTEDVSGDAKMFMAVEREDGVTWAELSKKYGWSIPSLKQMVAEGKTQLDELEKQQWQN